MIVYNLTRDSATWTTPQRCSPGSLNLAKAVKQRWPILLVNEGAYGCYNRRLTASGSKSVHGDGRALDFGHGWTPTAAQKAAMTQCVNHLAANAKHLGVQQIIYFHRIWTPDRGWRSYSSTDHNNHAHVEQTHEAGWSNPLPLTQALTVVVGPTPELGPPFVPPAPTLPVYSMENDMPRYVRGDGPVHSSAGQYTGPGAAVWLVNPDGSLTHVDGAKNDVLDKLAGDNPAGAPEVIPQTTVDRAPKRP